MNMKTIYIEFGKPLDDDSELYEGFKEIIAKYENKIEFIINKKNKKSQIRIFYNNGTGLNWLEKNANKEILVVNNLEEIITIVDFYLKYDYKTLKKTGRK